MLLDLSTQVLPPVYRCRGKKCYLDPVRKKLIYITPEETVRQQMLAYLMQTLSVPVDMLAVEVHLSHYGCASRRRADILIHAARDDGMLTPIAAIECKAPGVILGDYASDQLTDYCNKLGCDYAMMINGTEAFVYRYDESQDVYLQIDGLPSYTELLAGECTPYQPGELPPRVSHDEISAYLRQFPEEVPEIGVQTRHPLACATFNLLECLLDPRHQMPAQEYAMFHLIRDCGVRTLSYGNHGGGTFNGLYRSFLIEVGESTEMVSLGISPYITEAHSDVVKTSLNVAIDHERQSHHALQLILDDNVSVVGHTIRVHHHGRIAVGHCGSGNVQDLRDFVRLNRPALLKGDRFFIGELVDNALWHLDTPEIMAFIENLICYALLRDQYRERVKRARLQGGI